jgi:hypothetical protein
MKKEILSLSLVTLCFLLTGCLASGSGNYRPPAEAFKDQGFQNSITIDKPFDEVWAKGISNIGKSFFVINTIEKDSGIINISYSGKPEDYIECGTITSEVTDASGNKRTYVFDANRSFYRYQCVEQGRSGFGTPHPVLLNITRSVSLEGRFNVVVQKINNTSTIVSVNGRYIVTKDINTDSTAPQFFRGGTMKDTINFNSKGCERFPGAGNFEGTECCSKNKLESDVLILFK